MAPSRRLSIRRRHDHTRRTATTRSQPVRCALLSISLVAVTALVLTACTPAPLEFPDWTIPVPEGTKIIEYAAVPMEERIERIELVEDLAIGQRGFGRE